MFKVLVEGCAPKRGTEHSACVDLFASEDVVIGAGETKVVGLGVAIDFENYLKDRVEEQQDSHKHMHSLIKKHVDVSYENYLKHKDYTNEDFVSDHHNGMKWVWNIRRHFEKFKNSHYLELDPRSSLRKKGLIVGVGKIDLDYPDEIKMIIHNPTKPYVITTSYYNGEGTKRGYVAHTDKFVIKKGDKIGQITLLEHKSYLFGIQTEDERTGGFGSTGA